MSRFGSWTTRSGLPAFNYEADHTRLPEAEWDTLVAGASRRHWAGVGNRRLQVFADNEGTVSVLDEHEGLRWLCAADPSGTGISRIEADGGHWGTSFSERPEGPVPRRTFGPTWFETETESEDLRVTRTVLCPEGDVPWLLVRVQLRALRRRLVLRHIEEWALRPRFLNFVVAQAGNPDDDARLEANARLGVVYDVESAPNLVRARERRTAVGARPGSPPVVHGSPQVLVLESLDETPAVPEPELDPHPVLRLATDVELADGEQAELWFRFGVEDGPGPADPSGLLADSLVALRSRLPRATSREAPQAEREIPWHAALLTGGACADGVLGGHTLDQGSLYSLELGFNGLARDQLQHALPLVYSEPDLAFSVLRNTLAWGAPNGRLAYLIDGAKDVRSGATLGFLQQNERPSDLALWALWLAAELLAATGDDAQFEAPVPYHPSYQAEPASLYEHLRRCFRHLCDEIGLGSNGLLRIHTCDWSDSHVGDLRGYGLTLAALAEGGESVMNAGIAAWVLPVFAAVAERMGDSATAREARDFGASQREAVAGLWNGRWFPRALVGDLRLGDDMLFLEAQAWALISGAAQGSRAAELLTTIDETLRAGAPLGARRLWPVPDEGPPHVPGEGLRGGTWLALQAFLVWGAAKHDPSLACDEWRRMTLSNHTAAYPGIWEGTISGPDAYNSPESPRAGRTWGTRDAPFAMQAFPVNNLHAHGQPLFAYLRLLGVEPDADGALNVGGGERGAFESRVFRLAGDGHGSVESAGQVRIRSNHGDVAGGPGEVRW
jgi:Glycosyl hydrolase 36 superfamily, catalytic domain